MAYKCEILADSLNLKEERLTTFKLTYPRIIHAEIMTHRMLSRNAASCLSGDTAITIEKPSLLKKGQRCKHTNMTIKEICEKWFNGDSKGRNMKNKLKAMKLRCLNEETGVFTTTHITNCFIQGVQDVYEIELDNGYKIKCTENHRIFSEKGWITLKDYEVNHFNGITSYNSNIPKISTNGIYFNMDFITHERDKEKTLRKIAQEQGYSEKSLKPKSKGNSLVQKYEKIKSVKYVGKEETYDIEVEGAYHNFVANGFVVHNSRAVPVKKMIESVKNNMFTPLAIQKVHKGMQGSEYFEGKELEQARKLWIESAELALQQAEKMEKFGVTKQLCNRLLEPFMWHTVIVTSGEEGLNNFFNLRCPQYNLENVPTINADLTLNSKTITLIGKSKKALLKPINEIDNDYYIGFKKIINNYSDLDWLQFNKSQAEIHIQAIAELMWDAYNESTPKQLQTGEWHIPRFR